MENLKLAQNLRDYIVKRKFVMSISILIILLCVSVVAYFCLNNPVKKFETYFDSGKYEQAMAIYNKNSKNLNFENSIKEYLINKSNEIETNLDDGKITYEDAINELDKFSKSGLNNDEINSIKDLINNLNNSMNAYKNAKQLINENKSFDAIELLNQVIKKDKNYDDAQNLIKDQLNSAKKQKLDEAQNYASKEDYANALISIQSILKYLPDDAELKDKENTYKKSKADADKEAAKEKAVSILTQKNSKNNYTFIKMVTIEGQDYYAFEGVSHEAADDFLYCINIDTGELMYYMDDAHYMTEKQMDEEKAKAKAQREANKGIINSNSSGINYTIQSITYSAGANVSKIDIKCSNLGNKAFVVMLTITFYNSNNEVIGKADSGVNLEPNQWSMITPMCAGNVKNFDHFSVNEGLMDNSDFYKAKQEINEKYGFH